MKRVLFISTHNAARSQMAEALLKRIHGGMYEVFSAGIQPAVIDPHAVAVMKEIDIDMSEQFSKPLDEFLADEFDIVVTLCDDMGDGSSVVIAAKEYLTKTFDDPLLEDDTEDEIMIAFRKVRDEIKEWIQNSF